MPSSDDNVKVAVRVRPFNDREKSRNAVCVIEMADQTTSITNPNNPSDAKKFTFDYSYWSHDGYKERSDGYLEPANSKYADQRKVFNDLGQGVLENAWQGYNCSLFAYGQTGSGKSYSMVGYGANKGIVPIASEELFKKIGEKKGTKDTEYQVSVSMLEIYCEKVRDLFDPAGAPRGGLKVREHPSRGFYVEGLIESPVDNYKALQGKLDEGNKNRTIAATNMNSTSSRAHTIFQIIFRQKGTSSGGTTKTSIINLVDLAGSERHQDAGTEGDRMKEGIVINQSLSTLGRCIKALAEQQGKKDKGKVSVPYRDSVLTSLLKNALGGNSKTIMIAALSPADINYEETLSTLRFADSAKRIKTQAVVNEGATDRLIRELREENQRLQALVAAGGVAGGTALAGNQGEIDDLRRQLAQNKRDMATIETSWQQRLAEEATRKGGAVDPSALDAKRANTPHFWNLNEDPALTNMIVHFVNQGQSRIGSQSAPPPEILLSGMGIHKDHAYIINNGNKQITLTPQSSAARILVNGSPISGNQELFHNDRVHFGGNHLYVFANPYDYAKRVQRGEKFPHISYESAQAEIAQSTGIMGSRSGPRSKDDILLEDDLIKMLPMVAKANAMSGELKKNVTFEPVLVAPQARGLKQGATEIHIKMINNENDNEFMWEKNKFINRYYGMQELYQNYIDGHINWDVPKDRDPFYESPDKEVLIGNVHVYLQSLAYMVEIDEQLPVTDFKANERGVLHVLIVPCTPQGRELVGEYVEGPKELVGKTINYKVKIPEALGLPRKFVSSRCKYHFFGQDSDSVTMEVAGGNPAYGHEKMFSIKPVNSQFVDHLRDSALIIDVYGKQSDKRVKDVKIPNGVVVPKGGGGQIQNARIEAKLNRVNALLSQAAAGGSKSISVKDLQRAMNDEEMANGTAVVNGGPAEEKKSRERSEKHERSRDGSRSRRPSGSKKRE